MAFSVDPGPPDTIAVRPAIILKNGGNSGPISARVEKMEVQIEGILPVAGPPL
jgi:hypothetical protein